MSDIFERITERAQDSVNRGGMYAKEFGQQAVTPAHILLGIIEQNEQLVGFIFNKIGANTENIRTAVQSVVKSQPRVSGGELFMSREAQEMLERADAEAKKMCDSYITI